MTTLAASTTFTITPVTPASESVSVLVLPIAGPGAGTGRLIHPTLGTFDYGSRPDAWSGFRTDVTIPPVWQSVMTLGGAANTLWAGNIKDVVVEELWNQELTLTTDDFDVINSFYTNPPNPTLGMPTGYVQWWPSYASDLGFYVMILAVPCGQAGDGQGFDDVSDLVDGDGDSWIHGPMSIRMRIAGRVE